MVGKQLVEMGTKMRPYIMLEESDCGPGIEVSLCDLPREEILAKWPGGWQGGDAGDRGRLGAPNDTPWDHFALLQSLKRKFQIATCEGIIRGEFPVDKTAILLHEGEPIPPKTWWEKICAWFRGTYRQHWVILQAVEPGKDVSVWSGRKGEDAIWHFTAEAFRLAYSRGWPNCAFEVGRGSGKITFWQSLVANSTGKF